MPAAETRPVVLLLRAAANTFRAAASLVCSFLFIDSSRYDESNSVES